MARLPDGTEISGEKLGACIIVMTPKYVIFVEKPGEGRGLECPGGHGEADDASLQECAERELWQETGIHIDPAKMHFVDSPRITYVPGTDEVAYVTAMFVVEISCLPSTLKKIGNDGEIVHVVERSKVRAYDPEKAQEMTIFPSHLTDIHAVLRMLYRRRRRGFNLL